MKEPISLSIFFPAFNEEENIETAVESALEFAQESPYVSDVEIIVINDGSTDRTKEIATELALRYPIVRVVSHAKNRGYGAALKTGFQAATKEYVFFTDADMQFDVLELNNLLVHVPQYDAVVGYRAPRRDPFMRLLNARGWKMLNRVFFGLRVRDIDCAFKLFETDAVQRVPLYANGAMVSAELLIRLARRGVRIKEAPVSHLPRRFGAATGAKPAVIARALREMLALYFGELGIAGHKQAFRYMSVGVINTCLDAVLYIALTRTTDVFAEHLVAAKFFSFLAGTLSSLILNRAWTFGLTERLTWGEIARFYAAVSVSLVINVEAMNVLVGWGMYDLFALSISTVLTFAASFTLSKFWVFRAQPEPRFARS